MKLKTALMSLAALAVAVPVVAQEAAPAASDGAMPPPPGRHGKMLQQFDTDGNGAISAEEFAEIGLGDLVAGDADKNGELSVDEIKAVMDKRRNERMAEMFKRRFDVDGDGKITVAELKDRQEKRFALADANNDGQISREEFAKMRGAMGGRHGDRDGPRGGWRPWSHN